jgi:hypothetical protein
MINAALTAKEDGKIVDVKSNKKGSEPKNSTTTGICMFFEGVVALRVPACGRQA